MNLSVKSFGQLALFAVALFFFACSDETSIVGYKNPIPKFKSSYVEIPVTTSVLMFDSVRTSNIDANNDINRFLLGKYNDPLVGPVTSTIYSQFMASALPVDKENLEFENIELQLFVDFYLYGSDGVSTQQFTVYQLNEDLPYSRSTTISSSAGGQQKPVETTYHYKKYYHAESEATYASTLPLGNGSFSVDASEYRSILAGEAEFDSTFVTVPLDQDWGENLFNIITAAGFRKDFVNDPTIFLDVFKGLAILPTNSDKIVGIAISPLTRLRMTYLEKNTDGTVKEIRYLNFPIGTTGQVSFNSITHDFTGTALEGLTTPYEDFEPADGKRYIVSGSRVVTKIDFSKFVEFATSDTIDQIAINAAELVIKNVDDPGNFAPPRNLLVKLINDDNHAKKLAYPGRTTQYGDDLAAISTYQSMVNFDYRNYSFNSSIVFDSTYNIVNDLGSFLTLGYSSDKKSYTGTASLFFQQLYNKKEGEPLFTKAILLPYTPTQSSSLAYGSHTVGKTLNRVVFDKDNVVLRIYYTVPTVNQNQ